VADPKVEDVFRTNGVPTYTFVQPREYEHLLISLRTAGRGVVVEGPSGIGKTTAVEKVIAQLGVSGSVTKLSARKKQEVEYIRELPALGKVGTVIVDDFHKLDDSAKASLADYLKVLADEGNAGTKLVIIGINRAGDSLIQLAPDLINRVDIIRFESNPDNKVEELLNKGEQALNITLNVKREIVEEARGSFYIAQLLALEACIGSSIRERSEGQSAIEISFEGYVRGFGTVYRLNSVQSAKLFAKARE
jgi:hypothetical protein